MKVQIKDNLYFVNFKYVTNDNNAIVTECKILLKTGVNPEENNRAVLGFIGVGYATPYHTDKFDKEAGRQIALTNALKDSSFNKVTRKIFWNTYRNWGKLRY